MRLRADCTTDTISIHAPREGSDTAGDARLGRDAHFNPRSPRGERPHDQPENERHNRFQSTLPARGATELLIHITQRTRDFNPRSPRGERPPPGRSLSKDLAFQSTLPARGATSCALLTPSFSLFQSTLPARGATPVLSLLSPSLSKFQSTLPARGATYSYRISSRAGHHFNPRSPRGERHGELIF